jgi:hypothetical protein
MPVSAIGVSLLAGNPRPCRAEYYVGTTSQFESISFDVGLNGIRNFSVPNVNAGCTPSSHLYGGQLSVPSWPINSDGSFRLAWSGTSTVTYSGYPPSPTTFQNLIEGHVQSSIAAGDFKEDTQYAFNGTSYSCTSRTVTWTATLSP